MTATSKKKKLGGRNITLDRRGFTALSKKLKALGFNELDEEFIKKENKEQNAEPPKKNARIKEVSNQIIFGKWVKNYGIVIITSFDRVTRTFTNKGRVWMHVVDTTTDEKHYTTYFRRVNKFMDKVLLEAKFLNDRVFKNRPLDSKGKSMRIWQDVHKGQLFWKSTTKDVDQRTDFFFGIDRELYHHAISRYNQKRYYFLVARKDLEIVNYESDLRQVWSTEGKKKKAA